MKRTDVEREAMMAKARNRHQRRHPEETPTPESPDLSLFSAVSGAVEAMAHAAKRVVESVKEAIAPCELPPLPSTPAPGRAARNEMAL